MTIVGNLVDNALEAVRAKEPAPAAPRVTVTVHHVGTPRPGLLVRVADNGPGLPPQAEDGETLFRRGWSTKRDGGGIGLALVRQTAGRHGGQAQARDLPGGGAEFTVRLPLPGRAVRP